MGPGKTALYRYRAGLLREIPATAAREEEERLPRGKRRTRNVTEPSYSRFGGEAVKQGLALFANPFPQFARLLALAKQLLRDLQRGQDGDRLGVGRAASASARRGSGHLQMRPRP